MLGHCCRRQAESDIKAREAKLAAALEEAQRLRRALEEAKGAAAARAGVSREEHARVVAENTQLVTQVRKGRLQPECSLLQAPCLPSGALPGRRLAARTHAFVPPCLIACRFAEAAACCGAQKGGAADRRAAAAARTPGGGGAAAGVQSRAGRGAAGAAVTPAAMQQCCWWGAA